MYAYLECESSTKKSCHSTLTPMWKAARNVLDLITRVHLQTVPGVGENSSTDRSLNRLRDWGIVSTLQDYQITQTVSW